MKKFYCFYSPSPEWDGSFDLKDMIVVEAKDKRDVIRLLEKNDDFNLRLSVVYIFDIPPVSIYNHPRFFTIERISI